jgi:hypothetical protein
MREPPSAPKTSAPMIVLLLTYFSAKEDVERVRASTFDEDIQGKAINAVLAMTNFANEAMNRNGRYEEYQWLLVK